MKRLALISFLAVVAVSAMGQTGITPFSADTVVKTKQGQEMQGKMYISGDKMRMDQGAPGAMGGQMIFDMKNSTMYVVMPQQKMYMEMNTQSAKQRNPLLSNEYMKEFALSHLNDPCAIVEEATKRENRQITCKDLGTETVNGRSTRKIETTDKNGTETLWFDPELRFMVKMEDSKGGSFELQNIQEGPQPASLFEIPSGYQKMDMGQMMRGMQDRTPQ